MAVKEEKNEQVKTEEAPIGAGRLMPMAETKDVQQVIQPSDSVNPMVAMMIQAGRIDDIGQMLEYQKQWEENEAKKSFNRDMASFRAEAPVLKKDQHVSFKTSKGVTDYWHTSLGLMVDTINPILAKYNFNFNWRNNQSDAGLVSVTCTVTHKDGYSISDTLHSAPDDSGGKNSIQQVKSAVTYLRRATLESVLGLASESGGSDDDARNSVKPPETITEKQKNEIEEALKESTKTLQDIIDFANKAAKREDIESLDQVPAKGFQKIMEGIKSNPKEKA
jgi:hypothetical protein